MTRPSPQRCPACGRLSLRPTRDGKMLHCDNVMCFERLWRLDGNGALVPYLDVAGAGSKARRRMRRAGQARRRVR